MNHTDQAYHKDSTSENTKKFTNTNHYFLGHHYLLGHHYEPVHNKAPTTKELDWNINPTRMKDKLETKMEDFFTSEKECENNKITETTELWKNITKLNSLNNYPSYPNNGHYSNIGKQMTTVTINVAYNTQTKRKQPTDQHNSKNPPTTAPPA